MPLNEAVSQRLLELLKEKNMTQYRFAMNSGIAKSTVSRIVHCTYGSVVSLRILHEICQGLSMELKDFFDSPLFAAENLDP